MELLGGFEREIHSRASEPTNSRRGIRLGDANNAQGLLPRHYRDAARFTAAHHAVEKGFVVGVLRERAAFRVAQSQIFSYQRWRLVREYFCKINLEDGFLRGRRRKIRAGHPFKGAT